LKGDKEMAQYECKVCGYIYDEAEGCDEQGVAPGTTWANVPDSFECPLCGAGKDEFELK
jgi:rubredoxin